MVRALTFDAYGTLIQSERLRLVAQRIVSDHGLSAGIEAVFQAWIERYLVATQQAPFRTLRVIQREILGDVLRQFGVDADPAPYVEVFFEVTTKVELYPEVPAVFRALGGCRAAVVSNADHEHTRAWTFLLPVEFVIISEAVQAYKPDRRVFQAALEQFGLDAREVLHVGDSEVDDVEGARAAGLRTVWVNRTGRARRPGTAKPDYEINDLVALPALVRVP